MDERIRGSLTPDLAPDFCSDFDVNQTFSANPGTIRRVQTAYTTTGQISCVCNQNDAVNGVVYSWVRFSPSGGRKYAALMGDFNIPGVSFKNLSVLLYLMSIDWDPAALCWNNQPPIPTNAPFAEFFAESSAVLVSSVAQQIIIPNPSAFKGLLIKTVNDAGASLAVTFLLETGLVYNRSLYAFTNEP